MFKNRTMRNPTRHACVQRAVSHRSHQASILWIRNLSDLEDLDHEIMRSSNGVCLICSMSGHFARSAFWFDVHRATLVCGMKAFSVITF